MSWFDENLTIIVADHVVRIDLLSVVVFLGALAHSLALLFGLAKYRAGRGSRRGHARTP